jgi:hypothetical protein
MTLDYAAADICGAVSLQHGKADAGALIVFFRHCERSEAIQCGRDVWIASSLRSSQ